MREKMFGMTPPQESQSEPEKEAKKNKSGGKIGRWARKSAALAGAVGVGYFGSMQEGMAGGAPKMEKGAGPKLEHRESKARGIHEKTVESTGLFDVLYKDKESTWGVEYVQKKNKDGQGFLAERYVRIDNKSGETVVLGEYDNVIEAAEGISDIPDVPEKVKKHVGLAASAIKTERDFQSSGFTEPTGNSEGKTHVEERTFEGYNIKTKNKVEVDEAGKVVRLIDTEPLESEDSEK